MIENEAIHHKRQRKQMAEKLPTHTAFSYLGAARSLEKQCVGPPVCGHALALINLVPAMEKAKTLLEWEPISERLVTARFNSDYCKLSIIQCYAPTNDAEDETKDDFYEQLQTAISKVPQHVMLVIMGDRNAKVGSDNTDAENFMDRHGCGVKNENGERAIELCLCNKLVIGGTIFPHKNIYKVTWKSPDGRTVNQIDHILVNNKWRRSLRDVRELRGADPSEDDLNINTEPPTIEEVRNAIKSLKTRKAPGINSIHAKMLKADLDTSSKVLDNLFLVIWKEGDIPSDWSKCLIVKLPKKGNLRNCDNWRGITLLSVPS
ncbi:uncharacterized protein [Mytilus edulis]|uniref:uncharacterized protein n=1 Tax=Mytilus edulis TaxID=6550 RepID=UPI0039EE912B